MANQRRLSRVLCASDPRGSADALDSLGDLAKNGDVQAIAIAGDLGIGEDRSDSYRALFRTLGSIGLPAYWVPGPNDAPIADYLREAHNMELVFPLLRGLHGTAALSPDAHVLMGGMGGHVSDDPEAPREEISALRYPRWEAEYRLKILREFDELLTVLLFATPPAHRAHGDRGSDGIKELVGTYRPRLVVCGGERSSELIGRSVVVAPGSLAEGQYAIADLHSHEVRMAEIGSRV
jgi:Icc-related predicted phosphoesterase